MTFNGDHYSLLGSIAGHMGLGVKVCLVELCIHQYSLSTASCDGLYLRGGSFIFICTRVPYGAHYFSVSTRCLGAMAWE